MAVVVKRISHVNVNCSDLRRSREFYEKTLGIGLQALVHTAPPDQDLSGLGLGHGRWDAVLLYDGRGFPAPAIDLLEWKGPPPVGRPYETANHLGMFRLAFFVSDLTAMHARLRGAGVECFSPPAQLADDPAFAIDFFCCLDPDGTIVEFIEDPS